MAEGCPQRKIFVELANRLTEKPQKMKDFLEWYEGTNSPGDLRTAIVFRGPAHLTRKS